MGRLELRRCEAIEALENGIKGTLCIEAAIQADTEQRQMIVTPRTDACLHFLHPVLIHIIEKIAPFILIDNLVQVLRMNTQPICQMLYGLMPVEERFFIQHERMQLFGVGF